MGKHSQAGGTTNKVQWVGALGTWAAALGIFVGVGNLLFKKEKEASDRLLHIISLLDTKNCKTVRAGAVSTMGVYLGDYKQYQDRAFWVMANNLATEEDPLVRDNILNILKGAKASAIEPLACMNRFLVVEEMHRLSIFLFNIDLAFRSDLDNGNISKELRQEFEKNAVRLSENASVLIAEKGSRWLISNKDNEQKYTVTKEDDQLSIYRKDDELANLDGLSSEIEFKHLLSNNKLRDVTIALVAVLDKGSFPKEGKRYLRNTILSNFDSPARINLDNTDFEQGDLSCVRLKGASLKQSNLKQANLEKAFLWSVDLKRAELKQANLEKAFLWSVDLKRAELKQANLEFATLYKVDLTEAIMCGSNLFSARLEDTILKGADLTGMFLFSIDAKKYQSDLDDLDKGIISEDLQQAFENNGILLAVNPRVDIKEKGAEYVIVDIIDDFRKRCRISKEQGNLNIYSDTILDFANFQGVDLTGSLLTKASLQGATLTHANMVKATLQGADLFETDLTNVDLAGADLFEANLTNANLAGANLKGTILESANLAGANFQGANLEVLNIKKAINWQKAFFDDDVKQKLLNQQK